MDRESESYISDLCTRRHLDFCATRFDFDLSPSLSLSLNLQRLERKRSTMMHWLARPATALLPALLIGLWSAEEASAAPIATAGSQLTAQDWDQHVVQRGGTW